LVFVFIYIFGEQRCIVGIDIDILEYICEDGWRSWACDLGAAGVRDGEDGEEVLLELGAREEDGVAVCYWA
jgi:hypothetical protein